MPNGLPPDIDCLSDDEARPISSEVVAADAASLPDKAAKHARKRKVKQDSAQQRVDEVEAVFKRLRQVVFTNCKCKDSSCRDPWRNDHGKLHALFQSRLRLRDLPKHESDTEVVQLIQCQLLVLLFFYECYVHVALVLANGWHETSVAKVYHLLQRSGSRERYSLEIDGHPVCQRSFRLLYGIGKHRFGRLRRAALKDEGCPMDQRCLPKEGLLRPDSARPHIVEWLQKMYNTAAEPLPEAPTMMVEETFLKNPKIKLRGKKPRHRRRQGFLPQDLKGRKLKFLPPNTINGYCELCSLELGRRVNRRQFCLVWEETFPHLLIRNKSQHGKCGQCVRHRLVLKRLAKKPIARRAQMEYFRGHLQTQYKDRCRYWKNRSESIQGPLPDGSARLTLIIDSVDHSKFMLPRSLATQAKCFSNFIRPTLSTTAIICHGYGLFVYISEPNVVHDSSWSCDLLCHALSTVVSQFSLDLRKFHVEVHGDNSSKELKNNSCLRLLAGLTAAHRIRSGAVSTLMAGHSHEDIDATFSVLCAWIQRQQELHDAEDYVRSVADWLRSPGLRPNEAFKKVYK
ncbi:unnamed protein product, partial [Durusdinium trenchii]